jgi:hypothetical protein
VRASLPWGTLAFRCFFAAFMWLELASGRLAAARQLAHPRFLEPPQGQGRRTPLPRTRVIGDRWTALVMVRTMKGAVEPKARGALQGPGASGGGEKTWARSTLRSMRLRGCMVANTFHALGRMILCRGHRASWGGIMGASKHKAARP